MTISLPAQSITRKPKGMFSPALEPEGQILSLYQPQKGKCASYEEEERERVVREHFAGRREHFWMGRTGREDQAQERVESVLAAHAVS